MARTASPTIGAGISGATAGSVFFAGTGGVLAQDNSSIFFDDTNNRLGLMTTAPTHTLTLGSTGTGIAIYNTADQTTNYERVRMQWASNRFDITSGTGGSGSTRNIRIGTNSGADTSGGTAYIDIGAAVTTIVGRASPSVTQNVVINNGVGSTLSSGIYTVLTVSPIINQSSTAGYTILDLNPTLTAQGSGARNAILYRNASGSTLFGVDYLGVMSFSNAVTAGIAVASTHRIAVVDGGTTYYLLATTVA